MLPQASSPLLSGLGQDDVNGDGLGMNWVRAGRLCLVPEALSRRKRVGDDSVSQPPHSSHSSPLFRQPSSALAPTDLRTGQGQEPNSCPLALGTGKQAWRSAPTAPTSSLRITDGALSIPQLPSKPSPGSACSSWDSLPTGQPAQHGDGHIGVQERCEAFLAGHVLRQ